MQQRVVRKVCRPVQRRAPAQQGGGAHGEDLLVQQRRREHAGVAAIVQVDGQVEIARGQRLGTVFGHQAQLDVRVALLKARQARREPFGQERRDRAQAQGAADFPRVQAQQFGFDAAVGFGHRLRQALPFGAQFHTARPAQEQPIAQAFFQLAHLLADGARGDVQLFGTAGEGQVPGRTGEHV
ncbi:hypothetical protein D3C71_1525460 [compost metagenome]